MSSKSSSSSQGSNNNNDDDDASSNNSSQTPGSDNNNNNNNHDTVADLIKDVEQIHIGVSITDKIYTKKQSFSREITTLAKWIERSKRIIVVSGAGVSCSAGIPDFRSPGTGLYDNLQTYNLPFPEAVFDLKFFRKQPEPFISLASALWPSKHTPTYTHSFLALLAKDNKKKLLRNYSQNIDGLEYLAGMPAEHLVECHGHFRSSSCIQCRKPADQKQVEVDILQHARPTSCKHCKGLVKPDIVFFGEQLPSRFHNLLSKDTEASDLCIVIGTSLMVAPVNMIPEMVDCKVALINRETVGKQVDLECLGDCDHVIRQVAMALGWDKELDEHHEKVVKNAKVKTEMKD